MGPETCGTLHLGLGDSSGDVGGGVLAAELRGGAVEALLLALEARLARPGAVQVVTDSKGESTQSLGFQFDRVAILERIETPMVGASGQNVSGVERVDRRRPFDAARNLV